LKIGLAGFGRGGDGLAHQVLGATKTTVSPNDPAAVVIQGRPEQDDVASAVSERGEADCAEYAHVQRAGAELDLHFARVGRDPVQIEVGLLVQPLGFKERLPGRARATGGWKRDPYLARVSGPGGMEDGSERQRGARLKKGSAMHAGL